MLTRELHEDTKRLIAFLENTKHNDVISYDRLSKVIGRDIRQCRHRLYTAMLRVQGSQGATFSTISGVGYRRHGSDGVDLLTMCGKSRRHVRRMARKTNKSVGAAMGATNAISNARMLALAQEQRSLGFIVQFSRDRTVKAIPTGIKMNYPQVTAAMIEHLGLPKTTKPTI